MALKNHKDMDPRFQWKLSDIFETPEAWEAAYAKAKKAVEELGENAPWEEIAERIKTRTMYMGPEAYGLYTQNYSVMQGMTPSDGSLTKEDAPIKIDIAYTLVK